MPTLWCTLTIEHGPVDFEFDLDVAGITATSSTAVTNLAETDLKLRLQECPDFAPLIRYLSKGILPTNDDDARKIILEAPDYILEDDVLYHLYTPRIKNLARAKAVIRQLCVPVDLRPQVAIELHDNNAHVGFDRLYALARTKFYWSGMYTFLRQHVVTCQTCQQAKRPTGRGKTPLTSLPVPPPLTRWHMDFHGPLAPSDGKRYILVLIDTTSMWVELIPVADMTAQTVVGALYDNVIARFGVPKGLSVLTDNGSAFIAQLSSSVKYLELNSISRRRTMHKLMCELYR
jgi:Integrase zinc binding domain/Integrase core domain